MKTAKKDTATTILPFNEALSGLIAMADLLRTLQPANGGPSPVITLTAKGIEMRMSDSGAAHSDAASVEALAKLEEQLETVRQATERLTAALHEKTAQLDATIASHAAAIETVRGALSQNEQLMENMVELLGPSEFSLGSNDEFTGIPSPGTPTVS